MKNATKKTIAILITLALFSLLLAGCAAKASDGEMVVGSAFGVSPIFLIICAVVFLLSAAFTLIVIVAIAIIIVVVIKRKKKKQLPPQNTSTVTEFYGN